MLPSPLDLREDTESAYSDTLDESEEELVQVKTSTQKVLRKKKSPMQITSTFVEEALIVKMLREAILIERASQKGAIIENAGLADLWSIISTKKQALKQRYIYYKFSC